MTTPNTQAPGSRAETSGQQSGGNARDQIRDVKNQVVDQAKNTFQQARDRASSSLGESKNQFADQFGTMADALRRTTEHLRSEDQQRIAGITDTVARQVEQVADYLRNKDARAMRQDLENLARRQPALLIGSALVLGLIGARFLKSSERRGGRYGDGQRFGRERSSATPAIPALTGLSAGTPRADTEAAMPELRQERSIGELFGQLSQDMTLLVRQEVQLARTEMTEKLSKLTTNLISVGAGGFVAYLGGLALMAALILAVRDLANISLAWSALIVGGILAIIGYVMLQRGLKELKRVELAPRRSVENIKDDVQSIKDDVQWAKEQRS